MGIDAKHSYRFHYLKSEAWKSVRAAVLVRDDSKCWFCDKQDFFNDVHHVVYPKNIWETGQRHCITLCRDCHERVHALMATEGGLEWINKIARKVGTFRFPLKNYVSDLKDHSSGVRKVLIGRIRIRLRSLQLIAGNLRAKIQRQEKKESRKFPSHQCTICKKESTTTPKTVFNSCSDWHLCEPCFGLFTSMMPLNPRTVDIRKCVDRIRSLCKPLNSSP